MECQPFRSHDSVHPGVLLGASESDPSQTLARLQATIARLEAELIASQRLATLGTMSAMIAHEINNLMTPLLARADFALGTGEPADMRKALERSRAQVHQAISVTQHVLAFAKPSAGPAEPCCLASVVQEAIQTTSRPFEKDGIELSVSVPDDLRVRAPFDLLRQALLNLLLNARQAMQGLHGKLTISARRDGDYAIIDVRDSGKGIPREQLENVINPFLSSADDDPSRTWQSVGLGLNVCRIIARRHGATIEARPNEDRGCTFRLRWPAER